MFGCSFRAKSFDSGSNVEPMQGGCILSDLGYLFSCLRVWQCQRQVWYLVLASVPNPFTQNLCPNSAGKQWIHVRKGQWHCAFYMTTSTLNGTKTICSTDFDFLDLNIASCKVRCQTTKYLHLDRSWHNCMTMLRMYPGKNANPRQNQAAREERSATSSYQLWVMQPSWMKKMPNQSPCPRKTCLLFVCVCVSLLSIWERTWSRKMLGKLWKNSNVFDDCECLIPACGGLNVPSRGKNNGLGRDSCDGTGLRAHS